MPGRLGVRKYTVVMEVSLTPAQAEAVRRHSRCLNISQSALLRALVDEAREYWMNEEMSDAVK